MNNTSTLCIFLPTENFYFVALHLKLSSIWYSLQLTELFAYELPSKAPISSNIFVYNFYNLNTQQRLFVFLKQGSKKEQLSSITELFSSANWLERELSELQGVFFVGKKDIRNLMLQYGDNSAPLRKSYPSIGVKEIFYDVTDDFLVQLPITLQF